MSTILPETAKVEQQKIQINPLNREHAKFIALMVRGGITCDQIRAALADGHTVDTWQVS